MSEEIHDPENLTLNTLHLVELDPEALNATAQAFQDFLRKPRMIGQERVQREAAETMGRLEGTLRNFERPLDSIIALGPSGTGKTMIFELMAQSLFGEKRAMTKLSGPEYQEEHAISKLIGSPPGYIGSNWDERGPFPMLSPWNVGKYHYFAMLKGAVETTRKKSGTLEPTAQDLQNLIDDLWHKEHVYGDRIASLSDIIAALEREEPDELKSNKWESPEARSVWLRVKKMYERREEVVETAKAHIELYSIHLFGFYQMIDSALISLSSTMGQDFSFNPEIHKRAVILADELDKAHPAFIRIFYEICDRARITLQNGTVTDFSEAIIGMTSNKGDKEMEAIMRGRKMGFEPPTAVRHEEKDRALYRAARNAMNDMLFAPMRGRINRVWVFREFSSEEIKAIIQMEIRELQELLVEQKTGVVLRTSDAVIDFLWRASTDKPEEGARLVKKKLDHYLRDPVDTLMQTGQVQQGDILYADIGVRDNEKKPVFRADIRGRVVSDKTENDEAEEIAEE